jgi:hypothetical protein
MLQIPTGAAHRTARTPTGSHQEPVGVAETVDRPLVAIAGRMVLWSRGYAEWYLWVYAEW